MSAVRITPGTPTTVGQAARVAVDITALKRKRTTAKRRFGFQSDEYYDVQDAIEFKQDRLNEYFRNVKKAEALAKALPKPTRKEAAEGRRQAKKYRQIYTDAFSKEQEEFMNSIQVPESGAQVTGAERKRNARQKDENMVGTKAFNYSSINGHFLGHTFMVRSRILKYADEGPIGESISQIKSDISEVARRDVIPWLREVVTKLKICKVTPYMAALFHAPNGKASGEKDKFTDAQGNELEDTQLFQTPWQSTFTLSSVADVQDWVTSVCDTMFERLMEFPSRRLLQVLSISLSVAKAHSVVGGSYVELPATIDGKKSCVNINLGPYSAKNTHGCNKEIYEKHKNSCFLFSVLAHVYPVESGGEKALHYFKHVDKVDMTDITEPVSIEDMTRFEAKNKDIAISVYIYEEGKPVYPRRLADRHHSRKHDIKLLLLYISGKSHYVLIRHFNRLMNSQRRGLELLLTDANKKDYNGSRVCYICRVAFAEGLKKMRHQSSATGAYLGACCDLCYRDLPLEEAPETPLVIPRGGHGTMYHCPRCLYAFSNKSLLTDHASRPCGDVRVVMPEKGKNEIVFKNKNRMLIAPAIMYFDFEALTCELEVKDVSSRSFTQRIQKHEPVAGELRICVAEGVPNREKHEKSEVFIKEQCVKELIHAVFKNTVKITDEILCVNRPMTDVDTAAFNLANKCHVCRGPFTKDNDKVRDHDHITGKYRGAACNTCNLGLVIKKHVTVVCHNLRGYDSHLMMKDLAIYIEQMKTTLGPQWTTELLPIANTIEKYMSFNWRFTYDTGLLNDKGKPIKKRYETRFIDSLQHLSDSLENLSAKLTPAQKVYTKQAFGEKWELMAKKGFYPYDYMNSYERLDSTIPPPIEAFNSKLKGGEGIKAKDYEHVLKVWDELGCKNNWDYMLAYLKSDVTLLADVFETHRKMTMKYYGLDAAHYMTSPSMAWDAAIKMKDEENKKRKEKGEAPIILENMIDYDMYLFVERAKRGGITMIANRHAVANNKYIRAMDSAKEYEILEAKAREMSIKHLRKEGDRVTFKIHTKKYSMIRKGDKCFLYEGTREVAKPEGMEGECEGDNYILYLDANNLYGKAMSMKLPTGGYRWAEDMLDIEKLIAFDADKEQGCFVEVDCEAVPEHLHDLHNDYPMACEKMLITKDMVCPFTEKIFKASKRLDDKVEKLVPTLMAKRNYVCHIKNLQFYIAHGMVVSKVHKVLMFQQSEWLKRYIDFNTTKRAEKGRSEFELAFFKLMNNSVFGKTMEDVMGRIDVKLITNEVEAEKWSTNPRYRTHINFTETLVGVNLTKHEVRLDKPIAVGAAIMELSKIVMLRFHYDVMMKKYGPTRCKLLMTDTDSLVYQIVTGDVYRDMKEPGFFEEFDTSSYPREHPLFSTERQMLLGYFKDEQKGIPAREFVGLAPKMYCLDSHPKAKGVSKTVTKKYVIDDYRRVLEAAKLCAGGDETVLPYTMADNMALRASRHEMFLIRQRKIALNAGDNKKMWLRDGITGYSYGHYLTPQIMAGLI